MEPSEFAREPRMPMTATNTAAAPTTTATVISIHIISPPSQPRGLWRVCGEPFSRKRWAAGSEKQNAPSYYCVALVRRQKSGRQPSSSIEFRRVRTNIIVYAGAEHGSSGSRCRWPLVRCWRLGVVNDDNIDGTA